ncbi:MAG: hypothetical protein Q9175_004962 [Cornicularia normoerica]
MRTTTLLSALILLLISPAFAAPVVKRQGVSAELDAEQQPPPPAANCSHRERRDWIPFWRRDATIVGAHYCSFTQSGGATWRLGFGG